MSAPATIPSRLLRVALSVAGAATLMAGSTVVVGAVFPAATAAQEVSLDAVDALAQMGRADDARSLLTRWMDDAGRRAPRVDVQRSLWLRAVLTVDPSQAALDLRRLVVEHPGGAWSDQALLRLGQLAVARGDIAAAASTFRTLLRDYPSSPTRLAARQWLQENAERVAEADAESRARTRAADARGDDPASSEGDLRRVEGDAPPEVTDPPAEVHASPEGTDPPAEATVSPEPEPRPSGDFTVQVGAFAAEERARNLVADLAAAGFEPRLVALPGSDLLRVRVGRFADPESATRQYDRIRAKGFDAAVVAGAATEIPPEEVREE